jgi:hypothetical protein
MIEDILAEYCCQNRIVVNQDGDLEHCYVRLWIARDDAYFPAHIHFHFRDTMLIHFSDYDLRRDRVEDVRPMMVARLRNVESFFGDYLATYHLQCDEVESW